LLKPTHCVRRPALSALLPSLPTYAAAAAANIDDARGRIVISHSINTGL